MKIWFVGFVSCLLMMVSRASPLDDALRGGVLGVPWGTTLDQLVSIYPNGDHLFATTPGCRAYWVKDGQTYLSVPRARSGVLYALDEKNAVIGAVVAFEFERQLELRSVLTGMFGSPIVRSRRGIEKYGWKSESGMKVVVTEFGQGQQRIVWLAIYSAGYKASSEGCFDVVR
jgi:hypothetical protein